MADAQVMHPAIFLHRCLDLLYPPTCAVCGLSTAGDTVCAPCRRELPWIRAACPRCAEPVPANRPGPCPACRRGTPLLAQAIAPLHYAFPVDAMLKHLKFRRRTWIAPALAALVLPSLQASGITPDVMVPMPLHRWRHAVRGFNQATEIARVLARHAAIPLAHHLVRARATRPQTGLDAKARRRNLDGAFRVRRVPLPAHILLIDDVITTGTTIREAAAALLDAGATTVSALAIARA